MVLPRGQSNASENSFIFARVPRTLDKMGKKFKLIFNSSERI
jgi:hypothetical protein